MHEVEFSPSITIFSVYLSHGPHMTPSSPFPSHHILSRAISLRLCNSFKDSHACVCMYALRRPPSRREMKKTEFLFSFRVNFKMELYGNKTTYNIESVLYKNIDSSVSCAEKPRNFAH